MDKIYLALVLCSPLLLAFVLILLGMEERKENEAAKSLPSRFVYWGQLVLSIAALFTFSGVHYVEYSMVHLNEYHFELLFALKQYNFFLAIIVSIVFIVIEKLSYSYLHAEEEHAKFYGLKLLMNFAVMSFIFSINIDYLFFNWEIIGITSALLISYFYRRNQAVENSVFAFSVYRVCDAAFMLAALFLFHFYHTENVEYQASGIQSFVLGALLFLSIMGKSGVWPFSSWLPLALEGPTPSSNLYYMALSTHMGVIFLVKTQTLWESSMSIKVCMAIILAMSMVLSALSARVQVSVKASMAYATLTQVSLILLEVVFGFYHFALVHMAAHLLYRLAQMTNSASIIDQHNMIEKMIKSNIAFKKSGRSYFYALNGFGSEMIIKNFFVMLLFPFVLLDRLETRIFNFHRDSKTMRVMKEGVQK